MRTKFVEYNKWDLGDYLNSEPPYISSRLRFDVTPKGQFLGLPVNGRSVLLYENVIYKYEDGKIKQVWSVIDKAAIEAQIFDPAPLSRKMKKAAHVERPSFQLFLILALNHEERAPDRTSQFRLLSGKLKLLLLQFLRDLHPFRQLKSHGPLLRIIQGVHDVNP